MTTKTERPTFIGKKPNHSRQYLNLNTVGATVSLSNAGSIDKHWSLKSNPDVLATTSLTTTEGGFTTSPELPTKPILFTLKTLLTTGTRLMDTISSLNKLSV